MAMGLLCAAFVSLGVLGALLARMHERVFLTIVAVELQRRFSQQILTPVFCTQQCPWKWYRYKSIFKFPNMKQDLTIDLVRWKAARVSYSGYLNQYAVNNVLSQIIIDLKNGNIHWISDYIHAVMYLDIWNEIVNWIVSYYMIEISSV